MDSERVLSDLPDLETERLILRRLRMSDAPAVFEYASSSEVARYVIWEAHRYIADSEQFLAHVTGSYGKPDVDAFTWGVVLKDGGKLIGTISFWFARAHARAEIGYAIGQPYWGKGLTTEATRELIRYGFGSLGLNRIEARCDPDNVASSRVMEKVGMSFEGILREQMLVKGKYDDLKMYSILRREYSG